MNLEFFEPAEAAAIMKCTEAWLRAGAAAGRFPHEKWGKGKVVFTSEHIEAIARMLDVQPLPPAEQPHASSEYGPGGAAISDG